MGWKLGIDTGGTFSDCVLLDEDGNYHISKVPSSADNPKKVFSEALELLAQSRGINVGELIKRISLILHGTTRAVNALLQLKVAKTGLICTKGFRDILELREGRKESHDYFLPLPPILVPRYLRIGVEERIGADGSHVTPLNEGDVLKAVQKFKSDGVEAVAVCFLHSYANPEHEKRVLRILTKEFPEAYVSVSHEILPQIREFERTSTTVTNACLGPPMKKYINDLESLLRSLGYSGQIRYMQSNGGVASGEMLVKKPVLSLNSGPAAGVAAGAFFGRLVENDNVITIDMGGTSLDTALINKGTTDIVTKSDYNRIRLGIPLVNVNSIGAGGGSIAWIDSGGLLRVGPQSAEASPGPACYDRGGLEPTVTDACVVLGYFNPDSLLGGKLEIKNKAASDVFNTKIAGPLNKNLGQSALGVLRVANLNMSDAIRVVSLERGYDTRDFIMVSAGGCGAACAAWLAKELSISKVIIPKIASLFCAFGALVSRIRHDYSKTYTTRLNDADCERLNDIFKAMEENAHKDLEREGVHKNDVHLERFLDMKYEGEVDECMVSIPRFKITKKRLAELAELLHRAHEELFTFRDENALPEIVNVRLTAFGPEPEIKLIKKPKTSKDPKKAKKGTRKCLFDEQKGYEEIPVYDGEKIEVGNVIQGPAIVEEVTTTIVVIPGSRLELDGRDFYLLTLQE